MDIKTHHKIDQTLCGTPVLLEENRCVVEFKGNPKMIADESGLVHGGFVFGLADYAAMLAVNHPNVVLGSAEIKFLKPVKQGDLLTAEAVVMESEGKKRAVVTTVRRGDDTVFEGTMICFVLPKHVLASMP